MKIAIAGCGKVGATLIEQLRKENHDVTIIDTDESRMAYVNDSQDVMAVVARVRNPVYRDTMGVINEDLGLSMVVNPDLEAAHEMFNSLCFKSADQVEHFAKSRNQIYTCGIENGMPICNAKILEIANIVHARIFICAVKRDGEIFIPNGETKIQAGDTLSFVASTQDAEKFFKKLGKETGRVRDLTIIGGGRLGYYLG